MPHGSISNTKAFGGNPLSYFPYVPQPGESIILTHPASCNHRAAAPVTIANKPPSSFSMDSANKFHIVQDSYKRIKPDFFCSPRRKNQNVTFEPSGRFGLRSRRRRRRKLSKKSVQLLSRGASFFLPSLWSLSARAFFQKCILEIV